MKAKITALFLLTMVACGKSPGNGSGDASSGGSAGGSTSSNSTDATGPVATFSNKEAHFIGRVDTGARGGALLAWPGSGLQVRTVNATSITVRMQGQQYQQFNKVAVQVDGKTTQTLAVVDTTQSYTVHLPDIKAHDVVFIKLNEAANGVLLISQLDTNGVFVDPSNDGSRLIEFVGDTVATAYAADGPAGVTTCTKPVSILADPNFQNASESYAVRAAQALGADWSIVAATSRGLLYNLDGARGMTMRDVYTRTNPFDYTSAYNFAQPAQAVVISLGAMDVNYWFYNQTVASPDPTSFTAALVAMVQQVRGKYPQAGVLLTVGPTLSKFQCFNSGTYKGGACVDATGAAVPSTYGLLSGAVQAAVTAVGDAKVRYYEFSADSTNISCDYVPDAAGHQIMAAGLTNALKQLTGWSGPATVAGGSGSSGPTTIGGQNAAYVKAPITGDPNVTGVDPDQYPWCQVCAPSEYDKTVAGCAAPVGTQLACQSYCHMLDPTLTPWASDPPVSGNHNPIPEAVLGEHTTAVTRAHYIHSMEHGAVILAYNCPNGCDAELSVMRSVLAANKGKLVIMTPDPLMKTARFAAMSWTWLYTFDTPDAAALGCFINQHVLYGRECTNKVCKPLTGAVMSTVNGS